MKELLIDWGRWIAAGKRDPMSLSGGPNTPPTDDLLIADEEIGKLDEPLRNILILTYVVPGSKSSKAQGDRKILAGKLEIAEESLERKLRPLLGRKAAPYPEAQPASETA